MINVTKLYCGKSTPGDELRYNRAFSDRKPVVVWNCTRRCNLRCVHCYAGSRDQEYEGELNTAEARAMIEDLAGFGVPVLLFSGGEPLMRHDVFELGVYAQELGIRPVLSTNGTLIDSQTAVRIRDSGFAYAGVSIDGMAETNDRFRGSIGAFDDAMRGIENCLRIGQHVGLRLTLTKSNVQDLSAIFNLIERLEIPRACFYHLVYTGRGSRMVEEDLSREQARESVDSIIDKAADFDRRGVPTEILTVDNHCDGPYLYMRMLRENRVDAVDILRLLELNGGNASGVAIGCISNTGSVHPDQFWTSYTLGNVRERPFSAIWTDVSDPIMAGLKDRKPLLEGRCAEVNCRWIDMCNGNFRARAVAVYDDPWMQDPACYLADEEIRIL